MKVILFVVYIFISTHSIGQDTCHAVIDWHYLGEISVYETPRGKKICSMENDSVNEDFLHLTILDQKDSFFYVHISKTVKKESKVGWIKKADFIGTYKRNCNLGMDLILFSQRNDKEKNKVVIKNWRPKLLTIEKYVDKWVYVKVKHQNVIIKGWIEMKELCANSYSYCN